MTVGGIARSATFLLSGQVVSKVIALGYGILFARLLGPGNFGVYAFILAYLAVFTTIADLGLNRLVMRDVSRNPDQVGLYFWNILILRLFLAVGTFGVFIGSLALLGTDRHTLLLSAIAGLTLFPFAVSSTLDGIAVARQLMGLIAVSQSLLALLTAVFGGIVLLTGGDLEDLLIALVAAAVIHASAFLLYWSNRRLLGKPSTRPGFWRTAVLRAWPYAILGFLGIVYFRVDTIMLKFMKGPETTGQYAAAYRILEAAILIPGALTTAAFPVFAQLHGQRRDELWRLYASTMKMLAIVAIPLMGTLFILAPYVVRLFYGGAYAEAAAALQILSFAVLFAFIHSPTGALLLSAENLNLTVALSFLTAGLNIGLNLILIPRYSLLGAGLATVLSEAASFVIFILVAQHLMRSAFPIREAFTTPLLSGLAAAAVVVVFWPFHLVAALGGGLFVYTMLIVRLDWPLFSGVVSLRKLP